MNTNLKTVLHFSVLLALLVTTGCGQATERKGYVFEHQTHKPLPGVSVEIYMKQTLKDSLKTKVFTDHNGYYHITEKRSKSTTFLLHKDGYIDWVSSLTEDNDTVYLEEAGL